MEKHQTVEARKAMVRDLFLDHLNNGKVDSLEEILAEDYVGAEGQKGIGQFVETIGELRRGFPDIRYEVEDVVGEGDRVALKWTWRGTHKGQFRKFAATGRQVANSGMAFFKFKGDKIVQGWMQTDRLGFLQGIGVLQEN